MPYNTRRKSLSLPSLGIHVPTTAAARAAAAKSRASMSSNSSDTHAEHPSKRLKRAHTGTVPEEALEQTPPPSPQTLAASVEFDHEPTQIDLAAVNDDIVEAVIVQLQETANRPHLVKELATVLGQTLTSVQQSANPCAIISSRLASYLKRPNWSAKEPCPLAKELETVHPRRTYFFLTTHPRQPLPDFNASVQLPTPTLVTPSVSLTDDSVSVDVEGHRRQLSPSPEVDLSSNEFDEDGSEDDMMVPGSPIRDQRRQMPRDMRRNSPPLEKDEKEFTQTADGLLKRKLSQELPAPELLERPAVSEYGFRDEAWFGDNRKESSALVFASPAIKPLSGASRRDEDEETWFKFSKVIEWDRTAENIEIDELEYLLDAY